MKVMLVNGSPHEKGCTYTALLELANTFAKESIQPDIFWIGNKPLYSCIDFLYGTGIFCRPAFGEKPLLLNACKEYGMVLTLQRSWGEDGRTVA